MPEVLVEMRGRALWLCINREERRNALNEAVLSALIDGLKDAGQSGVRAVVLTGVGDKTFCAGGDLKPTADGDPFRVDPSELDNPVALFLKALEECPVPTIARVNGHAMGGGFGLVCACDFAVGVNTARLGTPEVKLGLFPLMILPAMLRVLDRRTLNRLCMTGGTLTADQAVLCGALSSAVAREDLDGAVETLVAEIAAGAPTAHRLGRRALATIADLPYLSGLEYAQRLLPGMARTDDAREGFKAFNEGRPAGWMQALTDASHGKQEL